MKNLQEIRKASGVRVEDASEAVFVETQTWRDWEKLKRVPPRRHARVRAFLLNKLIERRTQIDKFIEELSKAEKL